MLVVVSEVGGGGVVPPIMLYTFCFSRGRVARARGRLIYIYFMTEVPAMVSTSRTVVLSLNGE